MSDFTPNTVGYFKTADVREIEEWEPDEYGNTWYAVRFEGDAETLLWLAKNEPTVGKEYYGHVEPTKSGKRLRFRTDKLPEKPRVQDLPYQASRESPEVQESIHRSVALNDAVVVYQGKGKTATTDEILALAQEFYSWLRKEPINKPDDAAQEKPDSQWPDSPPPGMFADEERP